MCLPSACEQSIRYVYVLPEHSYKYLRNQNTYYKIVNEAPGAFTLSLFLSLVALTVGY